MVLPEADSKVFTEDEDEDEDEDEQIYQCRFELANRCMLM